MGTPIKGVEATEMAPVRFQRSFWDLWGIVLDLAGDQAACGVGLFQTRRIQSWTL
jgi:hypothetical protein